MRALKQKSSDLYFDQLPKSIQDTVKSCLLDAKDLNRSRPDCYPYNEDAINEVECRSRDGFHAASFNRGGLDLVQFTDLMGFYGSGYTPSHKKAAAEIERQIEYSIKCLQVHVLEKFESLFKKHGLTVDDIHHSTLSDNKELAPALREYEDSEYEFLSSESTIMYSLRFMYHGCESGIHTASVSAAINTEGPYHRSSISWEPGVFCEGAKEIEISWRIDSALERKLTAALKKCINEVW